MAPSVTRLGILAETERSSESCDQACTSSAEEATPIQSLAQCVGDSLRGHRDSPFAASLLIFGPDTALITLRGYLA